MVMAIDTSVPLVMKNLSSIALLLISTDV